VTGCPPTQCNPAKNISLSYSSLHLFTDSPPLPTPLVSTLIDNPVKQSFISLYRLCTAPFDPTLPTSALYTGVMCHSIRYVCRVCRGLCKVDETACTRYKERSHVRCCQSTYSEEFSIELCNNCTAGEQNECELLAAARAYQRHYPATFPLAPMASAVATGATSYRLEAPQRPYPDKGGLRLPQPQDVKEEQEKEKIKKTRGRSRK